MGEELDDPRRVEPAFLHGERAMLQAWLEFHRTTLQLKCEGLDGRDLRARPVATSSLSLHGVVRHMGDVERGWFTRVLLRAPDTPPLFCDPGVQDSDFVPIDAADWAADLAAWQAECDRSRQAASRFGLDDNGLRDGQDCSLRWIYVLNRPGFSGGSVLPGPRG